jgi:hypothetical protein
MSGTIVYLFFVLLTFISLIVRTWDNIKKTSWKQNLWELPLYLLLITLNLPLVIFVCVSNRFDLFIDEDDEEE